MADEKNREELRKVAEDILNGKIFTDRHIPPEDAEMIRSVFMIFSLMEEEHLKAAKEKLGDSGMVYEYLSEAGPMSANGYPMFLSARILSSEDATVVWEIYNEMKKALDAVK